VVLGALAPRYADRCCLADSGPDKIRMSGSYKARSAAPEQDWPGRSLQSVSIRQAA